MNCIIQENSIDEVSDMTSRLSTIQLEKTSASPPTLKLPHLFSLTPNSGKGGNMQKRQSQAQANQMGNMPEQKALEQLASTNHIDYLAQGFFCCYFVLIGKVNLFCF